MPRRTDEGNAQRPEPVKHARICELHLEEKSALSLLPGIRSEFDVKNELSITFEGHYIQIISNGEKNYEFSKRVWSGAVDACKKHHCYDVLGIADTTVPLTASDGYEHADLFEQLGIDNRYRIAWVEKNAEAYQAVYFVETVLFNRGFPGRVFLDVSDAKKWLLGNSEE